MDRITKRTMLMLASGELKPTATLSRIVLKHKPYCSALWDERCDCEPGIELWPAVYPETTTITPTFAEAG